MLIPFRRTVHPPSSIHHLLSITVFHYSEHSQVFFDCVIHLVSFTCVAPQVSLKYVIHSVSFTQVPNPMISIWCAYFDTNDKRSGQKVPVSSSLPLPHIIFLYPRLCQAAKRDPGVPFPGWICDGISGNDQLYHYQLSRTHDSSSRSTGSFLAMPHSFVWPLKRVPLLNCHVDHDNLSIICPSPFGHEFQPFYLGWASAKAAQLWKLGFVCVFLLALV